MTEPVSQTTGDDYAAELARRSMGQREAKMRRPDPRDAEIARLRAALRPFAACVYNDNGDMTVSASRAGYGDFCEAYLVYRATEPKEAARG